MGGKRSLRQQAKTVGHPSPGTATQQEVEALARQVYRSGEPPSPKMARFLLRQARLDAEG